MTLEESTSSSFSDCGEETKATHTRATEVSWGVCMLQQSHHLSPLKTSSLQLDPNEPTNAFDGLLMSCQSKEIPLHHGDTKNLKKHAV